MNYSLENFQPINNWVLIRFDKDFDPDTYQTASGIHVVNRNKFKGRESMATVIKIGKEYQNPYREWVPISDILTEGDKVLYYHPAGNHKISLDGEEYLLVRAEDIDCIVE